jgi:hypothetical protein
MLFFVDATSTTALSLSLIGVVIVFIWILYEIESQFKHQYLLIVHGLKIHGKHSWKHLFQGWPRVDEKTGVRI